MTEDDRFVRLLIDQVTETQREIKDGFARLHSRIDALAEKDLPGRMTRLEESAVSRPEFEPIKKAFYWLTGIVCAAVVTAILGLVFVSPSRGAAPARVVQADPRPSPTPSVRSGP